MSDLDCEAGDTCGIQMLILHLCTEAAIQKGQSEKGLIHTCNSIMDLLVSYKMVPVT